MQICSRNKNSDWEIPKAYDNHLFFPTVCSRSSLQCFVPLVDFLNLAVVYEVILWCPHQSDLLLKAVNLQVALGSCFQFPLMVIYTSNPQLYFNHFSMYAHVCARMLSGILLFATPWTVAARLLCSWDFPGKDTGVGCHFLLQGIFLTQRSNPHFLCLLHWRADSFSLSHLGSPFAICINIKSCLKIPQYYMLIISQESQGGKGTLSTDVGHIISRCPHTAKKIICTEERGKLEKDGAWKTRKKSYRTIPSFQLLKPEILGIILDSSLFLIECVFNSVANSYFLYLQNTYKSAVVWMFVSP